MSWQRWRGLHVPMAGNRLGSTGCGSNSNSVCSYKFPSSILACVYSEVDATGKVSRKQQCGTRPLELQCGFFFCFLGFFFPFRRSVFWKEPLWCCMDENCSCKVTNAQSFGCKAHRRQWRDVSGGVHEFWTGPLYVPVVTSQLWAVLWSVVVLLARAVLAYILQWPDLCSKCFVILEVSDL